MLCTHVYCIIISTAFVNKSFITTDTIRYLSLHDNKFLRYFPGHTKRSITQFIILCTHIHTITHTHHHTITPSHTHRVVSLMMSPINDTFLSGSLDRTIRLWDLRSPNCQGLMHLNCTPIASFDPEGLIFAAGVDSRQLKLYDLRTFDKVSVVSVYMQFPI